MDKMQLGPWVFTPSEYSISDGVIQKELEPLLSKLLYFFAANPGKILSRQQLVDTIWQQNFVDDNAINRAISELRKALQHPALMQAPIKTHHRKGYSLQLQPLFSPAISGINQTSEQRPAHPQTTTVSLKKSQRPLNWLAVLTLLCLASVGSVLYFFAAEPELTTDRQQAEGKPQIVEVDIINQQKITWYKGIEARPLVSPDKQLLAYSHTQPDDTVRVMVRKLGVSAGNTLQEVAIAADNKMFNVQTWQPDSRQLLIQVIDNDGQHCEYQNYDFSEYPHYEVTMLTGCSGMTFGNAQLSKDGQWLYYSKGSSGMYSSNALLAENLNSSTVQTLLAAPSAGLGVTMLALSADGSKLAYILMPESNKPDIYLYDPASREHTRLASLPFPVLLLGLEWSADQASLLLPGADAILQLNIADKSLTVLKVPEGITVGELSLLGDNQAYISAMTANSISLNAMQLIKVSQAFNDTERQIHFVNNAAGSSTALAVSPTDANQYAFAANWTGSWQLWLHNNGRNTQLTEINVGEQHLINSISWSGDSRYIAFAKQGNLYLYDTLQQQLINKRENNDIGQPVWLPDNSGLVLTRLQDNRQNLWQLDLVSNNFSQLTFSAGNFAQFDAGGQLHYHRDGKLYQYVDGARQDVEIKSNNDNNFMAVWLLQAKQHYRFSMLGHIEQYDPVTGDIRHSQLPYKLMALHPDPHNPDNLYATVFVTPELALEFIQWQTTAAH